MASHQVKGTMESQNQPRLGIDNDNHLEDGNSCNNPLRWLLLDLSEEGPNERRCVLRHGPKIRVQGQKEQLGNTQHNVTAL